MTELIDGYICESMVEDAALAWLKELGFEVLYGPDIAPGEPAAERSDPSFAMWFWMAGSGTHLPT